MCGGGVPEDNSDKVAAIEARTAREEAARAAAEEKKQEQMFNRNLEGSFNSALRDAQRYFQTQGVDASRYGGDIRREAQAIRGSIPFLDANPGTYFSGMGEGLYGDLTTGYQNKKVDTLNDLFGDGFARKNIADTSDDATLEAILGEQRSTAEQYLDNLLARGVITNAGYQGGVRNLDTQTGSARGSLNSIGQGVIAGGRGDIDNLINEALGTASSLDLGDKFNPYEYKTQANDELTKFMQSLDQTIRDQAPTNLFNTSGLAGVAGQAQGAQNTPFDTNALAGIFGDEEDDTEKNKTGSSSSSTNSPFA